MSKQKRWSRIIAISIISVILVPLLVACGNTNAEDANQERVLRIATTQGYNSDYDYFRQQFTDLYEFTHPNITVEFVSLNDESGNNYNMRVDNPDAEQPKKPIDILKEAMEGTSPPDIVMVELEQLAGLIQENLLINLETDMQKDKVNIDEFVPAVVEGIRDQSEDGRLYALAPMFTASALAYNKKLFTDAGLAFPTDGMTWDETFQLARQVTRGEGNDRIYGLTLNAYRYNDAFYDMSTYTAPLEMQMYDDKGENMSVDTEQWRDAWQTFYELKKDKIFPEQPNWEEMQNVQQGPYDYHSLLSGKVAMSIINYYDVSEMINANRNAANIENFEAVDWDVVSVPTHPEAPGVGGQVWLNGIMGISTKAENPEDAWEFIRFLMSEDWAKQKSKSVSTFVTWKKFNQTREGLDYNLNAFFANTPVKNNMLNNTLYIEKPDIWQVQNIGQMKFNEVMNGDKNVADALKEWQTEGDALLKKMTENNGRLDNGGAMEIFGSSEAISVEKMEVMQAAGEIEMDTVEVVD